MTETALSNESGEHRVGVKPERIRRESEGLCELRQAATCGRASQEAHRGRCVARRAETFARKTVSGEARKSGHTHAEQAARSARRRSARGVSTSVPVTRDRTTWRGTAAMPIRSEGYSRSVPIRREYGIDAQAQFQHARQTDAAKRRSLAGAARLRSPRGTARGRSDGPTARSGRNRDFPLPGRGLASLATMDFGGGVALGECQGTKIWRR